MNSKQACDSAESLSVVWFQWIITSTTPVTVVTSRTKLTSESDKNGARLVASTTGAGTHCSHPAIANAMSDQTPQRCWSPFGAVPSSPIKNGPTAKFTQAAASNTTSGRIWLMADVRC